MLGQVITSMKGLTALRHFTHILLRHFVFTDVSLTVVFSYELAAAVVARVGAYTFVCVHMRYVFCVADESALAQGAFVRFGGSTHVRPPVEFQVPFRGKRLVAYDAEVRPFAAMC